MSSITFTPSTGSAVTIVGNIVYDSNFTYYRLNQRKFKTADGGDVVYDNGPTIGKVNVLIKRLSKTDGAAFKTFIKDTLVFMKNTFTMTVPTGLDLGLGDGVTLTACRLQQPNMDGIFEFVAPGVYNLNLEFEFGVS